MSEITIGEMRVRTSFNPDNNSVVDQIKQKAAAIINMMDDSSRPSSPIKPRAIIREVFDLQDILEAMPRESRADPAEFDRLISFAIDVLSPVGSSYDPRDCMEQVETAAMWAVKAATCAPAAVSAT